MFNSGQTQNATALPVFNFRPLNFELANVYERKIRKETMFEMSRQTKFCVD